MIVAYVTCVNILNWCCICVCVCGALLGTWDCTNGCVVEIMTVAMS